MPTRRGAWAAAVCVGPAANPSKAIVFSVTANAGDLIVVPCGYFAQNSAAPPATPGGYSVINTTYLSGNGVCVYTKVAAGGETGVTVSMTDTGTSSGFVLTAAVYDTNAGLDGAAAAQANASASANVTSPTRTPTVTGDMLLFVGGTSSSDHTWTAPTSPAGFASAITANNACVGPGDNVYVAELIYNSVSATGSIVAAINAPTDSSGGITLLIKASAATTILSGLRGPDIVKYPRQRPGKSPMATFRSPAPRIGQPYPIATAAVTTVNATVGTYTWAGVQVDQYNIVTNAPPGTYTWAGTNAALFGNVINAPSGAYSWAGTAAATINTVVSAPPGTWSWAGTTATLEDNIVNVTVGGWTWAGTTAATFGNIVNAPSGTWSWAGTAASLFGNVINAPSGAYTWAGVTVAFPVTTNATVGAYTWAGTTASLEDYLLNATVGTWSWAGTTIDSFGNVVAVTPGTYSWAGTTTSFPSTTIIVNATLGAYSWDGVPITIGGAVAGDPRKAGTRRAYPGEEKRKRVEVLYIGNEVYVIPEAEIPELRQKLIQAKKLYRDNKKRYTPVQVVGIPPEGEDFTVKVAISFDFNVWLRQFQTNTADIGLEDRLRADAALKLGEATKLRRRRTAMALLLGSDL